MDITENIQYLRANSLLRITFFITLKMSGFEPTKQHMREVLLCYVNERKCCHRLLQETFGERALYKTACRGWFRRFKCYHFDLEHKERPGQPKEFEEENLEALLGEDRCHILKQLSDRLNDTEMAVSKRFHILGLVLKTENWLPHELSERQHEKRKTISESLLE